MPLLRFVSRQTMICYDHGMTQSILERLKSSLAESDSENRKDWSRQIVEGGVPLENLLSLFHLDQKTAQRFMWLIGDVCELEPDAVVPCLPFLFSLRDQMPFPGMRRSVAKWLWLTNVPSSVEDEAVGQLLDWLNGPGSTIGCKSYAAKALFELAVQKRVSVNHLKRILKRQTENKNEAFGSRMDKLRRQLGEI